MAIEEPRERFGGLRRIVAALPHPAARKARPGQGLDELDWDPHAELKALLASGEPRVFSEDAVGRAMAAILGAGNEQDPAMRRHLVSSVFAELHPLDAERLAEQYAADVANLPGVPAPLRFTANRVLIDDRHRVADLEFTRLRKLLNRAIDDLADTAPRIRKQRHPLAARVKDVELAARRVAIANQFRIAHNDHEGRFVTRQFLTVIPSTRTSSGRVVEVFGDLRRATSVLIVVPGVTNHYTTFHETREQSEALARHAAIEYPDERIAVIEWMGYEVPGWVRGTLPHAANRGGPELRDFVESLDLGPDVQLTILGHSYGSIVVSEALKAGVRPDRVVFTGSPGVHADRTADLGMTDGSVFALAASRDVISRLRWHGKNPASEPFGATRLATDGYGHASYFKPGGLSLRNLIHVALGRVEQVVEAARESGPTDVNPGFAR